MLSSLEKTQKDVSLLFNKLLQDNAFPLVSLFSGPKYSGKMYAAQAVSRALGSDFSSTIIISDREFGRIIPAAIELYREKKTYRAALFLKNTISVFLSEFHGALLDTGTASVKKKFAEAGNCSELIEALPDIPENEIASFCASLEKSVASIIGNKASTGPVTVSQVRNIKAWCETSSIENKRKTVIIEGLENALPAACNALLKILEEPPEKTTFILISENISAILPTILSRVRVFNFKSLDKDAVKYIFDSISVSPDTFPDFDSFIWKYSGADEKLLEQCASELITTGKTDLPALSAELDKSQSYDRFFFLVLKNLKENTDPSQADFEKKLYLYKELDSAVSRGRTFNQNMRLILDFVAFRTGEFIR
ncbi:MAG: hypothetical protein K6F82_07005 [Sphaerochaetaceae bacterium]|nr:hypothetical protein [Sphaerochaetaceae bacterium]